MIVLAGPNGAGKSTLFATRIESFFSGPFINPDLIQRDELRDPSPEAAYRASEIAAERRAEYLAAGRDFVTETVFSHPSKLALINEAKDRGFSVRVMHVGVEFPDISVLRVKGRVKEGGHAVPEAKIRERYERSAPLIRAAVLKADRGFVYDNSRIGILPRLCLTFHGGVLYRAAGGLPGWITGLYGPDLAA